MRQTLPPDLGGQNRINPHYGGAYALMWRFYRQPETIASLFEMQRSRASAGAAWLTSPMHRRPPPSFRSGRLPPP